MSDNLSTPEATESPVVLFVDDDADVRQAARLLLGRHGYRVREAADAAGARHALTSEAADVVLLDLNFARGATSGEEGLALLAEILAHDPRAVVVVVTAHSGVNIAVRAIRAGAVDFVTKPWSNARLIATLEVAVANRRREAGSTGDVAMLIGASAVVERTRDMIRRTAPSEASVLISGAAGTGKSLIARLIHQGSPRAAGPFVSIDLASLAGEEAEAALFGDPRRGHPGALVEAKGGVLVLDEIGALAAPVQARLLAALQTRASSQPADMRTLTLTRQRVETLRGFNHDLLHQLSTLELIAPGLSGGPDDIQALANHFLQLFAHRHGRIDRSLSSAASTWLCTSTWPDSVRGLRQAVERAVVLATGSMIEIADIVPPDATVLDDAALRSAPRLSDSEKALLTAALKRHGFNVSRAAAELGLTRPALYRRMARHGL